MESKEINVAVERLLAEIQRMYLKGNVKIPKKEKLIALAFNRHVKIQGLEPIYKGEDIVSDVNHLSATLFALAAKKKIALAKDNPRKSYQSKRCIRCRQLDLLILKNDFLIALSQLAEGFNLVGLKESFFEVNDTEKESGKEDEKDNILHFALSRLLINNGRTIQYLQDQICHCQEQAKRKEVKRNIRDIEIQVLLKIGWIIIRTSPLSPQFDNLSLTIRKGAEDPVVVSIPGRRIKGGRRSYPPDFFKEQ